jgi:DNA-3-methyladenine glycosylase I
VSFVIFVVNILFMKRYEKNDRCPWVDLSKADYVEYHDLEWGVPVHDDKVLFEFLTLEAAQAGLSWYTVLRKREAYRQAFAGFDPAKVARFGKRQIEALIKNAGIIRNRAKIVAAVNNAARFLDVQEEFGSFDSYVWRFVDGKPIVHRLKKLKDYPATSAESDVMSKDLKQRGFKFVGSTICYAHMQATGMVNDHATDCFRRPEIVERYPKTPSRAKTQRSGRRSFRP